MHNDLTIIQDSPSKVEKEKKCKGLVSILEITGIHRWSYSKANARSISSGVSISTPMYSVKTILIDTPYSR
jgi:hypothetical protein